MKQARLGDIVQVKSRIIGQFDYLRCVEDTPDYQKFERITEAEAQRHIQWTQMLDQLCGLEAGGRLRVRIWQDMHCRPRCDNYAGFYIEQDPKRPMLVKP